MRLLSLLPILVLMLFSPKPRMFGSIESATCAVRDLSEASSTLWLLCPDGRVARTDDGGDTWEENSLPPENKLRGIGALDSRKAFVVGDDGTLLATDDAGNTWRRIAVPTEEHLTAVSFAGESGWIAGWGGVMLHSPDGGQSWELQQTNVSQALEDVHFTDSDHGWAVGWVGVIIRTVDGGRTWSEVRTPAALWSLSSVHFLDASNGWAVGFMGQLLESTDGGRTWQKHESPVESWLTSIVFDEGGRGWIAAEDGVLVTDDGGESWEYVRIQDRLALTRIGFLGDSLVGATPFGLVQLTEAGEAMEEPRRIFAFGANSSGLERGAQGEIAGS